MTLFFITFGVFVFLVFIMAIGVMFRRKPIAGSCGGYAALKVECAAGCKNPCLKRRVANARARFFGQGTGR
ncbi:MAG: (Na+)-NQR maturation NqrM [Betaproteobacteria bacterium]|nr:(Na+)-NQR maturation NqrM [Betaproteobacteria bacterium]